MSDPRIVNVRDHGLEYGAPIVYVGRAVPGVYYGSDFANPFIPRGKGKGLIRVATAMTAVECYRRWLAGDPEFKDVQPERRILILDRIPWLAARVARGLALGCWCAPRPCHARVLLELIDALPEEPTHA